MRHAAGRIAQPVALEVGSEGQKQVARGALSSRNVDAELAIDRVQLPVDG
ncbi:MAG: hypothetical protein NVSMB25_17140 [Thermoleophilaceae bacterium]